MKWDINKIDLFLTSRPTRKELLSALADLRHEITKREFETGWIQKDVKKVESALQKMR